MRYHLVGQERRHGDLPCLICLGAFELAFQRLRDARLAYAQATLDLTIVREKLEQVIGQAFQQQSFGPIEALFREEEVALKVYESAVAELAQAEERYFTLRAALAYEQALTLAEPIPRQPLH